MWHGKVDEPSTLVCSELFMASTSLGLTFGRGTRENELGSTERKEEIKDEVSTGRREESAGGREGGRAAGR